MARPVLLLLLLFVVLSPIPQMAAEEHEALLYLQPPPREDAPANFTTYPPNGTQPVLVDPVSRDLTTTRWRWTFSGMPAEWELSTGSTIVVTLWIENLDRALPNTEVPDDPATVGALRITAGLVHESLEPFVAGTVYHRPPPTPTPGAVKVVVEVPVGENRAFNETLEGIFGLHVEVAAQTTAETILGVWVDGDMASSVTIPGFPREAFRAWEDESRARRTCLQQIQRQEPCVTPTTDEGDDDPENGRSPMPGAVLLPLIGLVVWSLRRR